MRWRDCNVSPHLHRHAHRCAPSASRCSCASAVRIYKKSNTAFGSYQRRAAALTQSTAESVRALGDKQAELECFRHLDHLERGARQQRLGTAESNFREEVCACGRTRAGDCDGRFRRLANLPLVGADRAYADAHGATVTDSTPRRGALLLLLLRLLLLLMLMLLLRCGRTVCRAGGAIE
jgi:hypothetical protein